MKFCIIGSGQAAVMAAKAISDQGIKPLILDFGENLPNENQILVDKLSLSDPLIWNNDDIEKVTYNPSIRKNIIFKYIFGSGYLYKKNNKFLPTSNYKTYLAQNLAKGGFSKGWGGAVLPVDKTDMDDWPISHSELVPYFKKVLSYIPITGEKDMLDDNFSFYSKSFSKLKYDNQTVDMLNDLKLYLKNNKIKNDFKVGKSRIAMNGIDCRYCGICLSGCPYKVLYTSDQLLDELISQNKVDYIPNVFVNKIKEIKNRIIVEFKNLNTKRNEKLDFDKVFLGAGAPGTARIMIKSTKMFDKKITLLDSEKFVIPFLRFKSSKMEWPNVNTFPSIFIESRFKEISKRWIHMQISGINDLILDRIYAKSVYGINAFGKLISPFLSRLMIGYCSLHSDDSNSISLTLTKKRDVDHLTCSLIKNKNTDYIINKYSNLMLRNGIKFNSLFIPFFKKKWLPGLTGHYGGSFPMQNKYTRWNTSDKLGRPKNFNNLHIIDSSIFTSIPGTTIALNIMANSFRIADKITKILKS